MTPGRSFLLEYFGSQLISIESIDISIESGNISIESPHISIESTILSPIHDL